MAGQVRASEPREGQLLLGRQVPRVRALEESSAF